MSDTTDGSGSAEDRPRRPAPPRPDHRNLANRKPLPLTPIPVQVQPQPLPPQRQAPQMLRPGGQPDGQMLAKRRPRLLPPTPIQPQPVPVQLQPVPVQPQPQLPVVSPTPVIPDNQALAPNRQGRVSASKIGSLPQDQRVWSDNVLRALKLKSKGSQARVLAGAIAGVEQLRQANSPDLVEATRLLAIVTRAGDPPWKDARRAMAATDAKMKLDLLSIPPGTRTLQPLAGGGINATFVVNRLDADGQTRPAFLCKPAAPDNPHPELGDTVPGVPNGGEVIREALAGRAAQTFASQTGIDVRMPESHVVSLASDMVPGGLPNGAPITASIQEFGPGMRQIKSLTHQQKAAIPADQVAALAVYDLMTLNTDRHSGNIMCNDQGDMMPIDHGGSFVQGEPGRKRIAETMGGPHNVLLQLPAAFEPMPADMVRKLKAMKTTDYGASLKKDRDQVAAAHPSMAGKVDDEALAWAQKAARFAKLSARSKPPLSPGAMQVAFAAHADELLDAPDFDRAAQAVIAEATTHAATVRSVCLSDDIEHAELVRQLEALGWRAQERGQAPAENAIADPVLMMSIVDGGIRKGKNRTQQAESLLQARSAIPAPNVMKTRLLILRRDLITSMIACLDPNDRPAQTTALTLLQGTEDAQMATSTPLLATVRRLALAEQRLRYNAKAQAGVSTTSKAALAALDAEEREDPVTMTKDVADMK